MLLMGFDCKSKHAEQENDAQAVQRLKFYDFLR